MRVVKVIGSEVKGGYRFTAVLEDGSKEIVRAKATRKYLKAMRFDYKVASGKSGLAAYFSYTEFGLFNPNAIEIFNVEWSEGSAE